MPAGDMLRRKKGEETKGGGVRQVELELRILWDERGKADRCGFRRMVAQDETLIPP